MLARVSAVRALVPSRLVGAVSKTAPRFFSSAPAATSTSLLLFPFACPPSSFLAPTTLCTHISHLFSTTIFFDFFRLFHVRSMCWV